MNTKQAIEIIELSLEAEKRLNEKGLNCEPLIMAEEAALQALREKEERENQKPLTIEELMERNDPVWVSCKTLEGTDGYWCLCNKGVIVCPSGQNFDVRDIPHWKFYRWRVELCSK